MRQVGWDAGCFDDGVPENTERGDGVGQLLFGPNTALVGGHFDERNNSSGVLGRQESPLLPSFDSEEVILTVKYCFLHAVVISCNVRPNGLDQQLV